MSGSMDLDVRTRRLPGDVAVVELAGEMDMYTTPKAREAVDALLEGKTYRLAIDLSRTVYLDSTALGMLKGTFDRCRTRGGGLRLVNPTVRIRRVLEITGLLTVFPVDESVEQAVATLTETAEATP